MLFALGWYKMLGTEAAAAVTFAPRERCPSNIAGK